MQPRRKLKKKPNFQTETAYHKITRATVCLRKTTSLGNITAGIGLYPEKNCRDRKLLQIYREYLLCQDLFILFFLLLFISSDSIVLQILYFSFLVAPRINHSVLKYAHT